MTDSIITKRYYRASNDEKRHKPLITGHTNRHGLGYWVVTTTDADETDLIRCVATHADALVIANQWADEYRAAWVEANMRRAA